MKLCERVQYKEKKEKRKQPDLSSKWENVMEKNYC